MLLTTDLVEVIVQFYLEQRSFYQVFYLPELMDIYGQIHFICGRAQQNGAIFLMLPAFRTTLKLPGVAYAVVKLADRKSVV